MKKRRVGEDEEELTNSFSMILEQEFGFASKLGLGVSNSHSLPPLSVFSLSFYEMNKWMEGEKGWVGL